MANDPSGNLYENVVGRPIGPQAGTLPPLQDNAHERYQRMVGWE